MWTHKETDSVRLKITLALKDLIMYLSMNPEVNLIVYIKNLQSKLKAKEYNSSHVKGVYIPKRKITNVIRV